MGGFEDLNNLMIFFALVHKFYSAKILHKYNIFSPNYFIKVFFFFNYILKNCINPVLILYWEGEKCRSLKKSLFFFYKKQKEVFFSFFLTGISRWLSCCGLGSTKDIAQGLLLGSGQPIDTSFKNLSISLKKDIQVTIPKIVQTKYKITCT